MSVDSQGEVSDKGADVRVIEGGAMQINGSESDAIHIRERERCRLIKARKSESDAMY